jgi:hypothetical protein
MTALACDPDPDPLLWDSVNVSLLDSVSVQVGDLHADSVYLAVEVVHVRTYPFSRLGWSTAMPQSQYIPRKTN